MSNTIALSADDQTLAEAIAARRDGIVEHVCELIGYHDSIDDLPRGSAPAAALGRLAARGAEIDLWEPAPEDLVDKPAVHRRDRHR